MRKFRKLIKKFALSLKEESKKYSWFIVLLRIPECALSGFYYLSVFGNFEKAKYFHRNINPIFKFRHKYIKEDCDDIRPNDLEDFKNKYLKDGVYKFKDIILPDIKNNLLMYIVYSDVLKVYTEFDDNNSYQVVDELDKNLPEGVYCYSGPNGEDINIHSEDVVLDVGAWVGDFSVYAAKKGAKVYAFEPSLSTIELLKKTIEYNNSDITIVPFGLGDKEGKVSFNENDDGYNTGGNSISEVGFSEINITTIDNFVKKNNLMRLDFIKADIEGYERNMLIGAVDTLKNLKPTLSICTYHLADDPEVLKKIILDANSEYVIIQRKKKLFAYIPKK